LLVVLMVATVAGLEAWSEASSYGIGGYVESHRAAGPFGPDYRSANRAGVFYAMFIPMLAGIVLFLRGRPLWRMLALGALVILVGAVLVTYSRQSYFIALFGIALLSLRRGVGTTIVLLVGFVCVMPWLPQGAFERVEETKQEGQLGEESYDESTESRWDIWAGAISMWSENPAGIGLNRFKQTIGNYSSYAGKDAHNYYVLTLAEAGVQGLIALLWLALAFWRLGSHLKRRAVDAESYALAISFQIAALCMLLGNIYGSPFTEGSVMAIFWALAGILERYAQLREQSVRSAMMQSETEAETEAAA
jgi:O-antigen ligase